METSNNLKSEFPYKNVLDEFRQYLHDTPVEGVLEDILYIHVERHLFTENGYLPEELQNIDIKKELQYFIHQNSSIEKYPTAILTKESITIFCDAFKQFLFEKHKVS